jgi:hypothetical protein
VITSLEKVEFFMKREEKTMAKKKSLYSGMLVIVLIFVMFLTGCATLTWNAPVTETGSISALETALSNARAREIAEYTIYLGFIHLGRATFDGFVVAQARAGRSIHILTTNYFFVTKVVAYAN